MSSVVTVYAVEHGEYSDRRTECLFTARADAEAYMARVAEIWAEADARDVYLYPRPDQQQIVEYQLWTGVPHVRAGDAATWETDYATEPGP